ncbi:MAG: peptidoglycan-binding protein [Deltaproteobacteria bacterium]|nr:peptidoglycan-binding protein [Deltaproteobacteria bacterium]
MPVRPPSPRNVTAASASQSSLPAPTGGLKYGMQGPEVARLQRALVKLGFMTKAEMATGPGTFGPRTMRAVAAFKQAHGLRPVGVFGEKAAAALAKALGSHAPAGGTAPSRPAQPERPSAPTAPERPTSVSVGNLRDLTWDKAADIIRANGGKVCPNGQPTVLAVRTRNAGTRQYEDAFVVLRPDGKMKTFAATTRPHFTYDTGGWTPGMLVPGNYEITPRWRDGKFNNDAFIVGTQNGMTVQIARDRNGDGRYSESEISNAVGSSEIRLHRGNSNGTPSSAGCLNVADYDGFLKYLGGRDMRFNLTLVED